MQKTLNREIINVLLNTNDEVLVIEDQVECSQLVKNFKGKVIETSATFPILENQ